MPGKSILLLLCTFFVLSIGLSDSGYAAGKENRGKPDKDPATACEIDFCVEFVDTSNEKITGDGDGPYCHGDDKVLAFTGKGPGFRLDTNRSGKGNTDVRYLDIDLQDFDAMDDDGNLLRPFNTELIKVDLRFDKSDGGLDLCFDGSNTGSGTVPLTISFEVSGATDNRNTLTYGAPAGDHSCGDPVMVTRTTGPEEWTIVGGKACLWDGAFDALIFKGEPIREIIDGPEDASFSAELTRN